MKGKKEKHSFFSSMNSKFFRSIVFRTAPILLVVIVLMISITVISYTIEIKNNFIKEKDKQLSTIESLMSVRMEEVSSIARTISKDSDFTTISSESDESGYQMAKTLGRYLVGNVFIEQLAFYRISEPDTLYVASGKLSFKTFNEVYMGLSSIESQQIINDIQKINKINVKLLLYGDKEENSYLSYTYPIPLYSDKPLAYVLILLPISEVYSVINQQITNCTGKITIYDGSGEEIYSISNVDENTINQSLFEDSFSKKNGETFRDGGNEYIIQKKTSLKNNWTYTSIIKINDISYGENNRFALVFLLLIIFFIALISILIIVINQYNPINKLAKTLTTDNEKFDEQVVLSKTIETLKGDSEEKKRFEAAYNEANEANKAKSVFFSNMSHDIRTPMNAIVGMTEIAMNHIDDPDYVKICLQKVKVASQYLLDIINNVLDMSRIESGRFTLSSDIIELPKLISSIETILNENLRTKNQTLNIYVDNINHEKIMGDNIRLVQVFMNILSNSIKFTPNGGFLELTIDEKPSKRPEYADYTFTFKDNGIGMNKEFVSKVFDTFSRDESAYSSKIEGTGLGMAITKNFIKLMGGTIECQSEVNKGTTFIVKLCMEVVEDKLIISKNKYNNINVLIIGTKDKCTNQSKAFTYLGAKVENAYDINGAIEIINNSLLRKEKYQFIIINQTNEDVNGVYSVTKLKEIINDIQVSFILVVRDLLSVDSDLAIDSGISTIVQYPIFKSTAINILENKVKVIETKDSEIVNLKGVNVLLVEDNIVNIQIAHSLINETEANVIEAVNGREAVDIFEKSDEFFFDIIFMDLQMPVMNGYEATSAIRALERKDANSVLIYAMTANTFDEDVRQVKESGMNGHLGKPYSPNELYSILKKTIKNKK